VRSVSSRNGSAVTSTPPIASRTVTGWGSDRNVGDSPPGDSENSTVYAPDGAGCTLWAPRGEAPTGGTDTQNAHQEELEAAGGHDDRGTRSE
jgi:hypothetical protein